MSYFDTTEAALVDTGGAGKFTGRLAVPALAVPGSHWVTGNGQRSKRSAQAPFRGQANWRQFRNGPTHEDDNATENVLSSATVPDLNLKWVYNTRGRPIVQSSPAVVNGVVYVGSDDRNVYALNAQIGAKLWSYSAGISVDSPSTVANEVVYADSNDGKVYAFSLPGGRGDGVHRPDPASLQSTRVSDQPASRIFSSSQLSCERCPRSSFTEWNRCGSAR